MKQLIQVTANIEAKQVFDEFFKRADESQNHNSVRIVKPQHSRKEAETTAFNGLS